MKKKNGSKLSRFFKVIYLKFFRINDSPQKIALGFGLGVFLGVLPGTGLVASLFLAMLFRLNRASALLGSLLTNTWISFVSFVLSVKVGAFILGLDWHSVKDGWLHVLKDFHWRNLLELSVVDTILPVVLGYFVVSFCIGILAYIISLVVVIRIKKAKREKEGGKNERKRGG
ncbi:MAG: DUF2062 domain-containing protein [Candidatus Omnitrophica bacterium]|nr:DUF2062 domain-containing protein [Candidatus Omnitrophota bacterium]